MEFFSQLLVGAGDLWGGGVAHSVFILAIVISVGLMLGKIKVAGVIEIIAGSAAQDAVTGSALNVLGIQFLRHLHDSHLP